MLTPSELIPLLDLTLLSLDATKNDILTCVTKAAQHNAAAVCILPQHLKFIPTIVTVPRATVVNFPTGNEPHEHVLRDIKDAVLHHRLDEIDYVFPYQAYLAGDKPYALSCCFEAYQLCQQHGLLFKVILETGALPSSDIIYQLSCEVINSGCDFIKTSTGKIHQGATLSAATAMLSAIIDSQMPCGIKLSGGVKTIDDALSFVDLAERMTGRRIDKTWFRIGASSLLDEILLE